MLLQADTIAYIQTKLAKFSGEEREQLGSQLQQAVKLGLIVLILENLKKKDRVKFEKVVQEMTEVDMFFFAHAHVENFKKKYEAVIKNVAESFLATLEQGSQTYE